MKLVTYAVNGSTSIGAVVDGNVVDLPKAAKAAGVRGFPTTMLELLDAGALGAVKKVLADPKAQRAIVAPLNKVKLLAPLPRPRKILALAGNYAEHIREGGGEVQEKDTVTPRIFIKPASSVIGPGAPIIISRVAQFIDWEGELGVIIGKRGKYIPRERALQHVAGYTVFHDVSERELKIRERKESAEWDKFFDWLNGKWMDSFAPMGPWLVTRDEIKDVQNLNLTTKVNGKVEQSGNTGQMIFDVADLIHYASHLFTLEPGDVMATGTPAGVGHGKGIKLQPGDVVEIEIENVGVLRNPVKAEK
ncbi:MAG: fumarylacetoacetate hydrolase family protein [Abditibacteriales bacterium]|nr:fumarylacetoacetate hydrolase family protein [Abditibacteriales bacterium]MDW8366557.1 fumarylacetoacetate hydrolase family protein [Abditibacteriales bacterium]